MAYTLERLQCARQLFRMSRKRNAEDEILAAFTEPPYELRERKDRKTIMSWIDDDKDEDYDPRADSPYLKRKHASRGNRAQPRPAKRARTRSATPELSSSQGSEASDPLTHSRSVSSPGLDVDSWDVYWAIEPGSDNASTPYKLRTRKQHADKADPGAIFNAANADPRSDDNAFTSEGCLACQELQLPCTSVDNPHYYPCQNCRDDGIDCELVPAPKWKRGCENCRTGRRRGGLCSYYDADYDHSLPCQECLQHGFKCLAGPAKRQPVAGMTGVTGLGTVDQSSD